MEKQETSLEFVAVENIKEEWLQVEEASDGVWNELEVKTEPKEESTVVEHSIVVADGPGRSPECHFRRNGEDSCAVSWREDEVDTEFTSPGCSLYGEQKAPTKESPASSVEEEHLRDMEVVSGPREQEDAVEFVAVQSIKNEWSPDEEESGEFRNMLAVKVEPKDEIAVEEHSLVEGQGCDFHSDVDLGSLSPRGQETTIADEPVKKSLESTSLSKKICQCFALVKSTTSTIPNNLHTETCILKRKVPSMTFSEKEQTLDLNCQEYKCPICGKCLGNRAYLLRHLKIHSSGKSYTCDQCQRSFSRRRYLVSHLTIHSGEKPHKCEHCGLCFTLRTYLLCHLRIHSGEKPHKCKHCGLCFTYPSHLLNHLRIHSGENPHKCEQCGKCFQQGSSFRRHLKLHSTVERLKCDHCGKCFTFLYSFRRHLKIHTGEKPYKCEECGKCFAEKGNLIKHLKMHTGEKNYKCSHCGKCYTRLSTLNRHLTIHVTE